MAKYPLQQVLIVKKDRVQKAERVVEEKKRALKVEEEKLKKVEEERDAVLNHHDAKLAQLRKVLDEGTTSDEVLQMKAYLKVVKEKLAKEEEKVKQQEQQVRIAERNLEEAKRDLKQKRLEEEKIELHKKEWEKETRAEILKQEAKEQDEIGQVLYESHRKKKKET
ncbi:MAG: type III secretion T3S chaperone [Chlamydiales bacterium]|nr:type III secretion T3S chaperone [Chlamydiales bacterium]